MDVDSINPLEKIAAPARIGSTQDREKRRKRGDEFSFPHRPKEEESDVYEGAHEHGPVAEGESHSSSGEGTMVDGPPKHAPEVDSYIFHFDEELEQAFRDKGDTTVSITGGSPDAGSSL